MEPTKLSFSPHELALVRNAGWILTKNAILDKIKTTLAQISQWQQDYLLTSGWVWPADMQAHPPKISRGENYQGLPYLLLDFPRDFRKGHFFAIRTMFWWGRQISTTLHLSGEWQQYFQPKLLQGLPVLQKQGFFWGHGKEEWDHDIQGSQYQPLQNVTPTQWHSYLQGNEFMKIAAFHGMEEIEQAPFIWKAHFKLLVDQMV